ncbi:hypothetical protein KKA14_19070 [bacterium]|nr:hypothetical protein [bacterium]
MIKKILMPIFMNFRKPACTESDDPFCKMSVGEKNALNEARRIVKNYGAKFDNPFKSGYGRLDI